MYVITMSIYIDCREHYLKEQCHRLVDTNDLFKDLKIETGSLDVADVVIRSIDGTQTIYIERKSISDLSASIKDGRYREQSLRLSALPCHPHNVIYLIEGKMSDNLDGKAEGYGGTLLNKPTLYTAIASMLIYKGFTVFRTQSAADTADFIMVTARKIASSKKPMFYSHLPMPTPTGSCGGGGDEENLQSATAFVSAPTSYASVIRQKKSENITVDNIGVIMLSQIPGVSSSIAEVVMQAHKTIPQLITGLQTSPGCLTSLTTTLSNGKTRKISKTACSNIVTFLLQSSNV